MTPLPFSSILNPLRNTLRSALNTTARLPYRIPNRLTASRAIDGIPETTRRGASDVADGTGDAADGVSHCRGDPFSGAGCA